MEELISYICGMTLKDVAYAKHLLDYHGYTRIQDGEVILTATGEELRDKIIEKYGQNKTLQ